MINVKTRTRRPRGIVGKPTLFKLFNLSCLSSEIISRKPSRNFITRYIMAVFPSSPVHNNTRTKRKYLTYSPILRLHSIAIH